ncbi:MAG: hypothetical protein INF43_03365, partial [Alphaproteobacteria bacterium]|nr:hypothetical protein [Alphaproteobacteria bacterium]
MRAHRVLLTAALLAGLTAVGWAQSWGFSTVANISATLGVNDGRVCVGEGSRQDIGCPTYAPSVNNAGLLTATSLATGGLTVTGATSLSTVSATIGAFNSLTVGGVPITGSASGDRITSGTTTLVAVSNTSFVSLTQSGTNTAWFDPIRGLVTLGVSATGGISGTTGYFSSNVGIGTTAPGSELEVRDIGANNDVRINLRANTSQLFQIGRSSTQSFLDTISSTLNFYTDGTSTPGFVFTNTNRFGLGTLTPAASLTVVGEAQVGSSGAACVAGLAGAIRYNGGALQFCNGTTWTTLGSAGAADWYGLSNIPAQVQNVSNATTLAMNLVSTTNLSATLIQTAR